MKCLPTRRKTLFDSFYAFRGIGKLISRFEVLPETSGTSFHVWNSLSEMSGSSFHVLKSFPRRRELHFTFEIPFPRHREAHFTFWSPFRSVGNVYVQPNKGEPSLRDHQNPQQGLPTCWPKLTLKTHYVRWWTKECSLFFPLCNYYFMQNTNWFQ